jgi:hypothetical protein
VCLASPRKWRGASALRETISPGPPQQAERNRQQQHFRDQKRRLMHLANNNLAFDLKHSAAEVWLLGRAHGLLPTTT